MTNLELERTVEAMLINIGCVYIKPGRNSQPHLVHFDFYIPQFGLYIEVSTQDTNLDGIQEYLERAPNVWVLQGRVAVDMFIEMFPMWWTGVSRG